MGALAVLETKSVVAPIEKFKAGDSVSLKGQRLIMTVRATSGRKVTCDWHNEAADWVQTEFLVSQLEIVMPEEDEIEEAKREN